MFKLDTNYLDWQLKVAQSQNQDKYEDPVKKIIQICSLLMDKSGNNEK